MRLLIRSLVLLLLLTLIPQGAALAEGSSIRSQSMQCYTLYRLLMDEEANDEYRNNMLGSQAMFMGTLFAWSVKGANQDLTQSTFDMAHNIAKTNLLSLAQTQRSRVVDTLIDCEGWREQIVTFMALSPDDFSDVNTPQAIQRVMKQVPQPADSYLIENVSRMQLNLIVDQAVNRHLSKQGE